MGSAVQIVSTVSHGPFAASVTFVAIPATGTTAVLSAVTDVSVNSGAQRYARAAGFGVLAAGDLIDVSGCSNAVNNGRKRVTSVNATQMVVTGNDALVTEATGAAVTITRVDRLPDVIMLTGTSATGGKVDLGLADQVYPADGNKFWFLGDGVHHLVRRGGAEIIWYFGGAGTIVTVSAVGA